MRASLVLSIILLFNGICFANIINVPDDFETIQGAIDESEDGDTVLVQPGRYIENINFEGKAIVVGSPFLTTMDTTFIERTIIDGDSNGTVVEFIEGESNSTVFRGFTLTNGYVEEPDSFYPDGGGIYCRRSSPTLSDLLISNCHTPGSGGGIRLYEADMVLTDIIIRECNATLGGGIYERASQVTITRCTIIENNVTQHQILGAGGGIHCNGGIVVIDNCTIVGNSAEGNGGGISVGNGWVYIVNNIIAFNEAGRLGGGIYHMAEGSIINNYIYENSAEDGGGIWGGSEAIHNNTICKNTASGGGGGIYSNIAYNGIINCILWSNEARRDMQLYQLYTRERTKFNDIEGGWDEEGNINQNPLFLDWENNDYTLSEDSPCIDAGIALLIEGEDDTLIYVPRENYRGQRPDMGAFELGEPLRSEKKVKDYPSNFILHPAYPNPFNSTTTIRYSLPYSSNISLQIYNLLGRRMTTLFEGYQQVGVYTTNLNAGDLASGLYFVRLEGAGEVLSRKVMLMK